MLKPLVSKLRPDLSACLKDIAEKHASGKLKPIEDNLIIWQEQNATYSLNFGVSTIFFCQIVCAQRLFVFGDFHQQ